MHRAPLKVYLRMKMRRLKNLFRDEHAAELVEFALAATMFFTLVFGVVEFSLAMYADGFVAFAAQQGTRYAMVRGSDWKTACASVSSYGCKAAASDVQNYVLSLPHPGLTLTAANITPTWLQTTAAGDACVQYSQGCQVEVQVTYSLQMSLPFYSPAISLSSTSIETIQD
jgi:Flp pilus assembly protein TadG